MTGFLGAVIFSLAVGAEGSLHWPLDLPPALTSSFGEYRAGRFHAGIDLRTDGVTGKKVYSVADGHVSRVRTSPWGYGKALYVTHTDGVTAVYAHLSGFREDIRQYVYDAQHAAQSYTVDLYPQEDKFRVEGGEWIASSGQTGVGVPHLHFELRDAAGRPISPSSYGFSWPDDSPPRFRKLLVIPARAGATIDGDYRPRVLEAQREADGRYFVPPIRVSGPIRFAADVVDMWNGGRNRLGVRILQTSADRTTVFGMLNDRLSYDHMHDGAVAFHPFFLDAGLFLTQWKWPGNDTAPFNVKDYPGAYELNGAESTVVMTASDFNGNSSLLVVPLVPDPVAPRPAPGADVDSDGATVNLQCIGEWILVTVTFNGPEPETPQLFVDDALVDGGGKMIRIDRNTFRAAVEPAPDAAKLEIRVEHKGKGVYERSIVVMTRGAGGRVVEFGDVRIEAPSGAPYGRLFASVETLDRSDRAKIPLVTGSFRIWPEATPVDSPVTISIRAPESVPDFTHVYRENPGGWGFEGGILQDGWFSFQTRSFGTFALMHDDRPPELTPRNPPPGAKVGGRRPDITVSVRDIGSGVATVDAFVSGRWIIMEFDPEHGIAHWARDEDLPSGEQTMEFRVTDAAGNVTVVEQKVIVP